MKSLVTGSAGHRGEALMRVLGETGGDVVGLDIKPSRFTTVVGSIDDDECVGACMRGVDTVYHAVTLHKPHLATHDMRAFVDTNIRGTLTMFAQIDRVYVKRRRTQSATLAAEA